MNHQRTLIKYFFHETKKDNIKQKVISFQRTNIKFNSSTTQQQKDFNSLLINNPTQIRTCAPSVK